MQHQVGAVAHQGIDLALGGGELDPQGRGNFITHARIAIFHVVGVEPLAAPAALQVPGQTAGSGDNHRIVGQGLVEHPQHLALGQAGAGQLDELAQHRRVQRVLDLRHKILALIMHAVDPLQLGIQLRPGLGHPSAPVGAVGAAGQGLAQCLQAGAGIGQQLHAIELHGIAGVDIEVEKLHLGVLEQPLGRGGEIAVAGTDANDQVGLPGQQVGRQAAGFTDAAHVQWMAGQQRALAGLSLGHRDREALGKGLQGLVGRGVLDPATADQQRLALAPQQRHGVRQHRFGGWPPVDAMHPSGEEAQRVIVGLGLHILGQRQGHRAGLGRVGQHPHRLQRRAHQLLRAVDPVPVFAHRLEGIVGADAQVMELLDLLQHRVRLAAGEHVAGQQQQGNAVGRGGGRGGQHIGRAGAHRSGAGIDLAPQVLLGKPDGGMGHALLVAALVHPQLARVLLQRLADAQHIAVAEDRKDPGNEPALLPVHLDVLVIEEFHQGLGHGQSNRAHLCSFNGHTALSLFSVRKPACRRLQGGQARAWRRCWILRSRACCRSGRS